VKIRTQRGESPRSTISSAIRSGKIFFGASVHKDINVESPPQEVKVLELPAEGRPGRFFTRRGRYICNRERYFTGKADVGDPLTLRMRVSVPGNLIASTAACSTMWSNGRLPRRNELSIANVPTAP